MLQASAAPLICHCLVGPPSSGKTTLAHEIAAALTQPVTIVSADQIRETLYGDVAVQGPWSEIEPVLLLHIQGAIQAGQTVIYDATNAYRWWRQTLLLKLAELEIPQVQWVAWHLTTPLEVCLAWNQARPRHVPSAIIKAFYQALQRFPVLPAEGFTSIFSLRPDQESALGLATKIQHHLRQTKRSQQNRQNRTHHITPHRYSRLLDFDRLLHLLSLLLANPGLGHLRHDSADTLLKLLGQPRMPALLNDLDELAAVLSAQFSPIYADVNALALDLAWLTENQFFAPDSSSAPLTCPEPAPASFVPHRYSDWLTFDRLLSTVRYILHHPLSQAPLNENQSQPQSMVHLLAQQLHQARILANASTTTLRKDIQLILNPYHILPDKTIRKGYYLGTGILNSEDLLQVYELARKQVTGLDDVMGKATLERVEQRLRWAQFDLDYPVEVRTIASRSIVNPEWVSTISLANPNSLQDLAAYIRNAQKIRVGRIRGVAQFETFNQLEPEEDIWPLQIIFHNIAWYLGYEIATETQPGLLRYERLDRLYQLKDYGVRGKRSLQIHTATVTHLDTLRRYSAGLFLGKDVAAQTQFIKAHHSQRLQAMDTLKLQFTPQLFRFISEGTQRFPQEQIAMTRPENKDLHHEPSLKKVFTLPKAADPTHPYQFQVKLPPWSFQDVTLKAWVLGLGPGVKVIGPTAFQAWVIQELQQAAALYPS